MLGTKCTFFQVLRLGYWPNSLPPLDFVKQIDKKPKTHDGERGPENGYPVRQSSPRLDVKNSQNATKSIAQ